MNNNTSRVVFDNAVGQYFVGDFVFDLGSLYAHFEKVADLRDPRGVRYRLADVLTLILLAKLGVEDTLRGISDWLRYRCQVLVEALGLKRGTMPHPTTLSRILGYALDVINLEKTLQHYFDDRVQDSREVVIAIDGKTLRGSIPVGKTRGIHILAAYLVGEGLVLFQVEVERKENEISAAPRLLRQIDIRHKVVIGDAMHTQRALSIEIIRARGDYIWTTKGNQADIHETIARLFEPQPVSGGFSEIPTDFQTAMRINKGHGRLEKRTITTSAMLNDYLDWPYVGQVFKLERQFINLRTGEISEQTSYGLTSLSPAQATPARLLKLLRSYWAIENSLHYRRDVTFNEDRCRLKLGHAARTMATINNLALALLQHQGYTNIPDARRRYAAFPLEALTLIMLKP